MTTALTTAVITEARAAAETHQAGDRFPRLFSVVIELADQNAELLTALQDILLLAAQIHGEAMTGSVRRARAAIAKAGGR